MMRLLNSSRSTQTSRPPSRGRTSSLKPSRRTFSVKQRLFAAIEMRRRQDAACKQYLRHPDYPYHVDLA